MICLPSRGAHDVQHPFWILHLHKTQPLLENCWTAFNGILTTRRGIIAASIDCSQSRGLEAVLLFSQFISQFVFFVFFHRWQKIGIKKHVCVAQRVTFIKSAEQCMVITEELCESIKPDFFKCRTDIHNCMLSWIVNHLIKDDYFNIQI